MNPKIKFLSFLLSLLFLLAFSSTVLAQSGGSGNGKKSLRLPNGQSVVVEERVDNGARVRILDNQSGYNAATFNALDLQMTQETEQIMQRDFTAAKLAAQTASGGQTLEATSAVSGTAGKIAPYEVTYKSGSKNGYNGSARSYTYITGYRDRGWITVKIRVNGNSSGSWSGTTTPAFIQLNETLCFSGSSIGLSITWPPSLNIAGSQWCRSYASSNFNNTKYAGQSYTGAEAKSNVALYSATQSDNAVVRVSNYDYRVYSQVKLDWGL